MQPVVVLSRGMLCRVARQPDESPADAAERAWAVAGHLAAGRPEREAVCRSLMASLERRLKLVYDCS